MASKKVGLKLLENGLDYILHALEHLEEAGKDTRNYKYAVLHLNSGIELVLQEVLKQKHWAFTFAKIETANKDKYRQIIFNSLTMDQSIDRLINICGYKFDRSKFESLKVIRNRIEHNAFTDEITIIKTKCSEAIHEILNFISAYNKKKETKNENKLLEQIREKLVQFDTFFDFRMKQIDEQLQKEEVLFFCPVCSQETYSIKRHFCLFCNVKHKSGKETMFYYLHRIGDVDVSKRIHLSFELYGTCTNCNGKNIANVSNIFRTKNHNIAFLCFDCGHKITIDEAKKCKECERVLREKEDYLCTVCQLKTSMSSIGSFAVDTQEMMKNLSGPLLNLSYFGNQITEALAFNASQLSELLPKFDIGSALFPSINIEVEKISGLQSTIAKFASAVSQNLSASLASSIADNYRIIFSALENSPLHIDGNYLDKDFIEIMDDEDDEDGELPEGEPI